MSRPRATSVPSPASSRAPGPVSRALQPASPPPARIDGRLRGRRTAARAGGEAGGAAGRSGEVDAYVPPGAPQPPAGPAPRRPCAGRSPGRGVDPGEVYERLRRLGARALADAELLALWLQARPNRPPPVARAQRLLARFGSLHGLLTAAEGAYRCAPGLGSLRHAQAQALLAIATRVLRAPLCAGSVLDSPQRVRDWLSLWLAGREHEVFVVVFLDARHRLLGELELFRGTLTQTSVYPREVVKSALAANAAGVIFAHNHPSGIAEPSRADEQLTAVLREALALVDVRVLDHFVVARTDVVSFAERGLL